MNTQNTKKHFIASAVAHDAKAVVPMRSTFDVSAGIVTIPFEKLMMVTNIAIHNENNRVERFKSHARTVASTGQRITEVDMESFSWAAKNLVEALTLRNHLLLAQERDTLQIVYVPVVEDDGGALGGPSRGDLQYI